MTYQWYIENMQQINTLEPPASDTHLQEKNLKRGVSSEKSYEHIHFLNKNSLYAS